MWKRLALIASTTARPVSSGSIAARAASHSALWKSLAAVSSSASSGRSSGAYSIPVRVAPGNRHDTPMPIGASCILRLSAKPRTAYLAVE